MNIQTSRLTLKPIDQSDLDALVQLLTDDKVKQFYMLPDFAKREDAMTMAEKIRVLSQDPARYVAGIYHGAQLLGLFNETARENGQIEVGYALLPQFWGQGYATEALTAAIDFFLREGFQAVLAAAFSENEASMRVMVKSGMKRLDRQDALEYRGKIHRCIYFSTMKPQ